MTGLNDINGFHVHHSHVVAALDNATTGRSKKAVSAVEPA